MRRWEDDLKQRLTGKPALPKYWEYPELEKGNIHQQHCSNCFDLSCDSANIDKNKHQSLVLNCSMTNCKFECGARYHACKVSEHKIICPFGELAEEEYSRMFGLRESGCKPSSNTLILHPGPINRGVEIDSALADSEQSVIIDQVSNGVVIRMAILYLGCSEEVKEKK